MAKKAKVPTKLDIEELEEGSKYHVHSSSGNTYTVRYCGSGDADPEYVALWECNCPAGRHGRDCKHLNAVVNFVNEKYDY